MAAEVPADTGGAGRGRGWQSCKSAERPLRYFSLALLSVECVVPSGVSERVRFG